MDNKIVLEVGKMTQEQNIQFFEDMGDNFDNERGEFDGEHFEVMLETGIVWGDYLVVTGDDNYIQKDDDFADYLWI